MKRSRIYLVLAMLLALSLALTGCSPKEEPPTARDNYDSALALLQEDRISEAADAFAALGHYEDAPSYAMYCGALKAGQDGNYGLAARAFTALGSFRDSALQAAYYSGREYEQAELYEQAEKLYASVPLYADASERAAQMPGKAKERDYKRAAALQENKEYERAIAAFRALNGYSDSEERIETIREEIRKESYAAADTLEKNGELKSARDGFASLGEYSDCPARVTALDAAIAEQEQAAAAAKAEQENADKYARCTELEAAGDIIAAYNGFAALGDYRDSADKAAAMKDEAAYLLAGQKADNGQYSAARTDYQALGGYRDSAERARLLGILDMADSVTPLGRDMLGFRKGSLWGLINLADHYDLKPQWDDIGYYGDNGLAVAQANGGYGLIDRRGRCVLSYMYEGIKKGRNGMYAAVRSGGKNTYVFDLADRSGAVLSSWLTLGDSNNSNPGNKYNKYTLAGPDLTGGVMAAQKTDGTWSLLDGNGAELISGMDYLYLTGRKADSDSVIARKDGLFQFYGLDGKAMDENRWADIWPSSGGLAMVKSSEGRYGYIGIDDCHVVIEPVYAEAQPFSEGLAAVKVNGKWGFIDAAGAMVIEPAYVEAASFTNGYCAVTSDELGSHYIGKDGKLLYYKESLYARAVDMDDRGRFEAAIAAFEALGDYEDSAERAVQAREKINVSVYAHAEELEKAGDLAGAAEVFDWLGDYSDSRDRAAAAREAISRNAYAAAKQLEESGQLEEAIAAFTALGDYNGAAAHALEIRESINNGIYMQAQEQEAAGKYEDAIAWLKEIPDYLDSAERITALEEKIRQRDYNAAAALEDEGRFEEAITAFAAMKGYSDTAERITALEEKIRQRDYDAAAALEDEGRFEDAITAFAALNGYSDTADRIKGLRGKIQQRDYDAAAALEAEGKYSEAYNAFIALGAYADSAARAEAVTEKAAEQERMAAYAAAEEAENDGRLEEAEAAFAALGEYSDSAARAEAVREKIRARDYANAKALLDSEQYSEAVAAFTALGGYQDSPALLARAQTGADYQAALSMALSGDMVNAYYAFTALGDYQDSAKKAEIAGNLSRASKSTEITKGVLIYEFHELWGIANLNTNVITPVKYTSIEYDTSARYSTYNLLKVFLSGGNVSRSSYIHVNDKYGYINMNGEEIIPCSYILISDFSADGYCTVSTRSSSNDYKYSWGSVEYHSCFLFGIMDHTGRTITKVQWRTMGNSANPNWNQSNSGENLYKSYIGKTAIPEFSSGRMSVQLPNECWGFIDQTGKVLGEVKWYSIGQFSEGKAKVCEATEVKSGYSTKTQYKYGFIDEQGQVVGEVRWDQVAAYSNGYAAVQEDNLWGFIDRNCSLVIPCQYTEVNAFRADGTCDVKTKDGTWLVINTSGSVSFFGESGSVPAPAPAPAQEAGTPLREPRGMTEEEQAMTEEYTAWLMEMGLLTEEDAEWLRANNLMTSEVLEGILDYGIYGTQAIEMLKENPYWFDNP